MYVDVVLSDESKEELEHRLADWPTNIIRVRLNIRCLQISDRGDGKALRWMT